MICLQLGFTSFASNPGRGKPSLLLLKRFCHSHGSAATRHLSTKPVRQEAGQSMNTVGAQGKMVDRIQVVSQKYFVFLFILTTKGSRMPLRGVQAVARRAKPGSNVFETT
ncbi:MAG: hypothetical protein QM296_10605 [Bacillota bacterium]|nr:hypothetical protein [Bacillota bacterium]